MREVVKTVERSKGMTAHLPDGSFGSIQQGVMAVLHYVMSLPDCDTAVEANSVLTLPMCIGHDFPWC